MRRRGNRNRSGGRFGCSCESYGLYGAVARRGKYVLLETEAPLAFAGWRSCVRVTGVKHSHIITFFLQSVLILDGLSSFVQPSCGDLLSRGVEILYDIFIFYFFKIILQFMFIGTCILLLIHKKKKKWKHRVYWQ